MAKPESLDAVMRRAREMNPTPPATTQPGQPGQPGTPGTSQRQAATLVVARSPEPPPAGQNLRLEPGSTGDEEKLIVEGPAGWTATVGGAPAVVRDGKIVLNVPGGGAAQTVSVVWPQSGGGGGGTVPPAPTTRQFKLFFEKDKPLAADLAASTALYVNNRTPDVRFKTASGPVNEPAPPGGAQGSDLFRAWLDTLPSPRIINFEGNASFEQFPPGQDPLGTPADRETHDINLSRRRIDVARACMQGRGTFGRSIAKGHADAEAQGNLDRPEDRHVLCTWVGSGTPPPPPPPPPNVPEVRVTGTIQRPAPVITPGTPGTPGTPPGTGTTPPAIPSVPVPSSMPALVSFKLKFVQKEERKSVTLRYHRTEAVQRTYAPQGFIGLMLGEIDDLSKHFVEVDLDHPFFRNFEVTVDAPVDYARIGLNAIQVAVDYGDPANPATLKHEDMVFDPTTPTQATFTTFMSPALDLAYTASTQFHFAPEQATGWMGERLSYEIPAVQTIDRTLMVTPHEHLGFIEVSVIANRIDAEMVDRIVVDLRFEDPSGWVATKTMIVRAGDASQPWKVRTSSPDARAYSYVLTHHLKDGNPPVVDDPVISTANAVAVDDPFPGRAGPRPDPDVGPGAGADGVRRRDLHGCRQWDRTGGARAVQGRGSGCPALADDHPKPQGAGVRLEGAVRPEGRRAVRAADDPDHRDAGGAVDVSRAALEAVLDRLALEAPDAVARGRVALGRALGWMERTTWPEVSWRFSGLASGGPVELVWRPGRSGLFWTADPAAPEMERARRFRRGVAVLRANGTGLRAADRRLVARAFAAARGQWPVLVAGRHDGTGDAGKVYVHGLAVPEGFGDLAGVMTGADRPMMTGVANNGLRELYWDRQARRAGDLWRMRRDPALAPLAEALDATLGDWTGRGLDGEGRIGLSLTAGPDGRPVALAAFLFAKQAGGEAAVRDRLLREGGAANPALANLWAEGRLRPMLLTLAVTAAGSQAALGLKLPPG